MSDKQTTLRGVVKFYNADRGYGFIRFGNDLETYFHITSVANDCADPLKGDTVEFIPDKGKDGRPCARAVKII